VADNGNYKCMLRSGWFGLTRLVMEACCELMICKCHVAFKISVKKKNILPLSLFFLFWEVKNVLLGLKSINIVRSKLIIWR